MKIEATKFNNTQPVQATQRNEGKPAADKQTQSTSASATVVSEPVAESIRLAHKDLSHMPDVDQAKVRALKQAVREGKISVDLERLAEVMQDYHRR
ncbi:MAG: flagellar biosynthesis anti-sigma factor FlgM [Enterobacteriaceae bacterium]